jgi:tetratricopeptide (TPR) repeat protein
MKSTRRHELQENVLAHELADLKAFLDKYGNWLLGGAAVVALVILGVWYHRNRVSNQLTRQAAQFESSTRLLGDDEQREAALTTLAELAGEARSEVLQARASILLADYHAGRYQMAVRQGDPAAEPMQEARSWYERTLAEHADLKPFAGRAQIGLGLLAENRGQTETAREHYQKAIEAVDKASPIAFRARGRMANLQAWARPVPLASAPAEEAGEGDLGVPVPSSPAPTPPPPGPLDPAIPPATLPSE